MQQIAKREEKRETYCSLNEERPDTTHFNVEIFSICSCVSCTQPTIDHNIRSFGKINLVSLISLFSARVHCSSLTPHPVGFVLVHYVSEE